MKTKTILSVLLLAGCAATLLTAADYRIKEVKVLPIESYPARTTVGEVTIAADPYPTNEKSLSAFDIRNLNSRGYFPVHVVIRNSSSDFYTIRTRNILLVTSTGQHLYTTPATILVEDLTGAGLTRDASSSKSTSPLVDFTDKELTNRLIEPGAVVDGFLFFFTPEPRKDFFVGSTLYIPKIEQEGTRKPLGPFSIPLDPALSTAAPKLSD